MSKIAFAILTIAAAVPVPVFSQPQPRVWKVDGAQRHALVAAPEGKGPAPLVFVWHGHGGNMRGTAENWRVHTHWPQAIVVYPQGLPTESKSDPEGDKPGWQHLKGSDGDRDLHFLDAMLESLHKDFQVDDSRIYTMGFSNGAFFSYLLWSVKPETFAAIGVVAGRLWPEEHLTVPRPLLHIIGERDKRVETKDQRAAVNTAIKLNGASPKGEPCGPGCTFHQSPTGNHVRVRTWDGGHAYPPFASEAMVAFFKNHRKQ